MSGGIADSSESVKDDPGKLSTSSGEGARRPYEEQRLHQVCLWTACMRWEHTSLTGGCRITIAAPSSSQDRLVVPERKSMSTNEDSYARNGPLSVTKSQYSEG